MMFTGTIFIIKLSAPRVSSFHREKAISKQQICSSEHYGMVTTASDSIWWHRLAPQCACTALNSLHIWRDQYSAWTYYGDMLLKTADRIKILQRAISPGKGHMKGTATFPVSCFNTLKSAPYCASFRLPPSC